MPEEFLDDKERQRVYKKSKKKFGEAESNSILNTTGFIYSVDFFFYLKANYSGPFP